MYFTSNIKFLRKRRGRTQDEVAAALNLKRSTLSGYENGVAQPGIDILVSFSKYFNMSIDTLLKIDMTKLSESQLGELERGYDAYIKGSNLRVLTTTVGSDNVENIELVPEKAKAGYTTGYADPEYIEELPRFRLPFLSEKRKYRTFQLKGDSMLPIPDGSWVTGEYIQDWHEIISGKAYVVFTINDGIVFKVIENNLNKDGKLVLYSLNPIYEPYEVHINEVKEIWKFINYISNELPDPVLPEKQLFKAVATIKNDLERIKARIGKDISDADELK
ncbi:MAG TPA: LexA family transcriptional regulator [Bacteroidales bacterium]|jgi:transcriptional regulator with XRE-family HTH domain|nr:helix-turn-helix domain-containing protein [Bacteroidales bacterium]OQB65587.1 MAG: HTH-type transcriptional regulator Xre [Bacteroidetes bacterium ADurb.Bin145]HOU01127.1 LexA family transcriptional regulator [Bacteroidales bacterium]HQG62799.1 LexA family transcriptional regulator [Bacteroidales bacterium]HQK68337.1 LexA family transcriptional regulator [Bacteroidales bacterium]